MHHPTSTSAPYANMLGVIQTVLSSVEESLDKEDVAHPFLQKWCSEHEEHTARVWVKDRFAELAAHDYLILHVIRQQVRIELDRHEIEPMISALAYLSGQPFQYMAMFEAVLSLTVLFAYEAPHDNFEAGVRFASLCTDVIESSARGCLVCRPTRKALWELIERLEEAGEI